MTNVELLLLEKEIRKMWPESKYWKDGDHYVIYRDDEVMDEHYYHINNLEEFLKKVIDDAYMIYNDFYTEQIDDKEFGNAPVDFNYEDNDDFFYEVDKLYRDEEDRLNTMLENMNEGDDEYDSIQDQLKNYGID